MAVAYPEHPVAAWAPEKRAAIRDALGPRFASVEQREFFDSRAPELLYSGWMGAGKSRILCEKALFIAVNHPGCQVGLFRKTAASLPATTLRTLLRDVIPQHPGVIVGQNLSEHWWDVRTDGEPSRIYVLGLDPDPVTGVPSKIGSLDLAWAGVDEAVEVTQGDWIMIRGRLRDPRIDYHQIAAATNPAHPKHWLLEHFTADASPGRVMLRASGNSFLPPDYLEMLAGLPDNAIGRRLGKGEWAAAEGAIWRVMDWQVKAADAPARRTVVGVDWGFVHAFAAEAVGRSSTGRLSVRGELVARGLGLDQLVEPLAEFAERHDAETFACDPSEPGLMDQLARGLAQHRRDHAGCRLRASVTSAVNDVLPGIAAVDKALRDGMTIDPTCALLLSEVPGYTWMPAKGGGYQERPVEIDDDACDALRYAVMAFEPNPANPWAALAGTRAGGVA